MKSVSLWKMRKVETIEEFYNENSEECLRIFVKRSGISMCLS